MRFLDKKIHAFFIRHLTQTVFTVSQSLHCLSACALGYGTPAWLVTLLQDRSLAVSFSASSPSPHHSTIRWFVLVLASPIPYQGMCLLIVPCTYAAFAPHTHLSSFVPFHKSHPSSGSSWISPPPQSLPRGLYPQATLLNCSIIYCLHATRLTINQHLPAVWPSVIPEACRENLMRSSL